MWQKKTYIMFMHGLVTKNPSIGLYTEEIFYNEVG